MLEFAFPVHAQGERLCGLVVAVHHVGVEQVASFLGQRQPTRVVAQVDGLDQALVVQVLHRVVVDIEIAFWHDPEGTDRGQRAAVVAVEFVEAVAVYDPLAFLAPR